VLIKKEALPKNRDGLTIACHMKNRSNYFIESAFIIEVSLLIMLEEVSLLIMLVSGVVVIGVVDIVSVEVEVESLVLEELVSLQATSAPPIRATKRNFFI
jgi:uncharacterized Tic20 family protein